MNIKETIKETYLNANLNTMQMTGSAFHIVYGYSEYTLSIEVDIAVLGTVASKDYDLDEFICL